MNPFGNTKRLIIWSVIGTGISSITVQLITIREFLTQFHGNEITISLVLFCWLIVTGMGSLGAKAFKHSSITLYAALILFIALWPLGQILIIRYMREAFFIHGASPGFYAIFFYIVATTTPYCLVTGYILPYALDIIKDRNPDFTSGRLYIVDNIGDIIGGVLFSFLLVYWVKPFKTIAITSGLLIFTSLLLSAQNRKYYVLIGSVVWTCLFYTYALNGRFEQATLSTQYGDILRYTESPFGRIVITQEGPQYTFWESGRPLFSDANVIHVEEKIHYPLSQLERVRSILLVSGGLGETLEEVSKYDPARIDYVELDPHLTDIAQELGFLGQAPRLRVINADARHFMKTTSQKYDAIIMDLPAPDTFQINRFYTSEFFSLAKNRLHQGGIFSFAMDYSMNYMSDIRRRKLSVAYRTASRHFENVVVIPGGEAYFLCRDGGISTDIPARLRIRSIPTSYIEGFYAGNVTDERIREMHGGMEKEGAINTDFRPKMMHIIFMEWFFKHGTSPIIFLLVFSVMIPMYVFFMKKQEYVLFSTGVAAMGVEMLIIFLFQVIHGYIYLQIGAIVTVFLLGLFPGAVMGNLHDDPQRAPVLFSEAAFLGLLVLFFIWYHFFKGELHSIVFLTYGFVFSFLCGFQFPLITKWLGEERSPAAGCFAADLAGAAVGTFGVGTVLIPLMGIQSALLFLVFMKTSSLVVAYGSTHRTY
jgi:spermidine synthase